MDNCNCSVKTAYMKEWMTQADPPKESSAVIKMNGRSLLISSSKMTHCFKEWTIASCVFKKKYWFDKSLMLQIDPLINNCSQKLRYLERKLRLCVFQKSSSLGEVAVEKSP